MILNNETVSQNTGKYVSLGSLSIEDILSPNEYYKKDWEFYLTNKEKFDVSKFELPAKLEGDKPELEIITSEWEVPEIGKDFSYDINNTATLFRTTDNIKTQINSSSIYLKIARPSLRILKNVIGSEKDENLISDDSTGFTITVIGDDGTKYNVKLNSKKECTLNNLKYGVTYTVSELPIMNYILEGIDNNNILMMSNTDNILITITNKKKQ